MNNFLLDSDFLVDLDNYKQRELYVKVIALTLEEDPIDEIQGRVTGGSISVDGSSKLRRSCSLNLISDQLNVNEYLWCLNTKIRVLIGMRNYIKPQLYGEIVWFPQGTFVLNSFSISVNNTSSTIAIQGKDKMCLLNGDVGGNLTALSYAFDIVEEENGYSSYYKKKLPLHYIIREAVHTFANEPYHNIIINDLDDWGLELLTYRGEEPMYFIYSLEDEDISNMTINANQKYWYKKANGTYEERSIEQLSLTPDFKFKVLNDFISQDESNATIIYADKSGKNPYQLIKIEYGMTCGYRITDLVYPSDLILNVGEGLTSMLDKIVSMLGNFEYFYNLDGQFVFQKKRTYVNTSWNNLVNNGEEQWADSSAYTSSTVYSLYNSKLVSSFSNSPALNNVKNDFSIWGTKKGATGIDLPIHMRYAIDKKPTYYTTVDGTKTYTTKTEAEVEEDKKSGLLELLGRGYQKEPSRFGLSEDWWEVRDWAKAWEFSGLPVPTKDLGEYCPVRAIVHPEDTNPTVSSYYQDYPHYLVPRQVWDSWNIKNDSDQKYFVTEDFIFHPDGTYWDHHGLCSHSYTEWLNYFSEKGKYQGGYAYFYKPQVPAEDLKENGGQGLLLGSQIVYETDWRELIYQMALDHNKYGNLDNENPKVALVKVKSVEDGEYVILTREKYNADKSLYDETTLKEISLTTAIREQNPLFFPSGYTGYEHYYIDLLGFWRQIYNPDYDCTYEIEPITRIEFEAVKEPETLFYDAPVYENCTKETVYYNSIDYYTKEDNIYTIASMLTEQEFNRNKTKYYFIKDVEIQPVPIKTNSIVATETYYKIGDYEKTAKGSELKVGGAKDPKDYCKRTEELKKIQLFKLDPFHRAYLYNYYKQGTYYPVSEGITQSDYESSPWYYNRIKSGKQVCCTTVNIPAPKSRSTTCWFETQEGTKLNTYTLNEPSEDGSTDTQRTVTYNWEISNDDLTAISLDIMRNFDPNITLHTRLRQIPWYFCYYAYSYEPLIHPAIEFDSQGTYYVKSDIKEFNSAEENPPYWKADLLTNPEGLIFWFDFLDTDGELGSYSVKRIGDRPKAVNDKDVKAIYFRETPGVLFLNPDEWSEYSNGVDAWSKPTGYAYAQLPKYLQHLFSISSQGKSAKDVLDEYLYQYSYCTETVSISALPVYHLEPNVRVLIRDDNSHISGEYIVNKLTIPLDPKGSMSISAIKAVDRLY